MGKKCTQRSHFSKETLLEMARERALRRLTLQVRSHKAVSKDRVTDAVSTTARTIKRSTIKGRANSSVRNTDQSPYSLKSPGRAVYSRSTTDPTAHSESDSHFEQGSTVSLSRASEMARQQKTTTRSIKLVMARKQIDTMCSSTPKSKPKVNIKRVAPQRKKCDNRPTVTKTSTDRVRKHRQKMGLEGLMKKRADDRNYYKKRKELGIVKNIEQLSRREAKDRRKKWKEYSKKYRNNKKNCTELSSVATEASAETPGISETPLSVSHSLKSVSSLKKNKRIRQLENKLRQAKDKLKQMTTSLNRYKKKVQRTNKNSSSTVGTPSPGTKVRHILKGKIVTPAVRKALLFGEVLQKQDRITRATALKTRKDRYVYHQRFSNQLLLKYKLIGYAGHLITFKRYRLARKQSGLGLSYSQSSRSDALDSKIRRKVREFLHQDIHSRMCPGKRDKVIVHQVVFQKRLLLDTLKSLWRKYNQSTSSNLSYSTFCRLRPKWIIHPRGSDRETCLCTRHANTQLMIDKLHQLKLITSSTGDDLCKDLVCDVKNKDCMMRKCFECKARKVTTIPADNENDSVSYYEWRSRNEERTIKGKQATVKLMEKSIQLTTKSELIMKLNNTIPDFLVHVYAIHHQYCALKNKKDTLGAHECIIQCDFSENYCLKYHEEVQSMHFGASKKQMSMHTGVLYHADTLEASSEDGAKRLLCFPFCTVSGTLDHGVHAIWAHLWPILNLLKLEYPQVNTLHFLSDGPTSQYKNRSNIFAMSSLLAQINPNIAIATWNYSESGHGKGAMDGVGGVLKRSADRLVSHGHDISTVRQFLDIVAPACPGVSLFEITDHHIQSILKWIPNTVSPVPSIMKAHQVSWCRSQPRTVYLREYTCFACDAGDVCSHYPLGRGCVHFKAAEVENTFDTNVSFMRGGLALGHATTIQNNADINEQPVTEARKIVEENTDSDSIDETTTELEETVTQAINTTDVQPVETVTQPINTTDVQPVETVTQPINTTDVQLAVTTGDWVAVIYGSTWYPGLVESNIDDLLKINFMKRMGSKFVWPQPPEHQDILACDILCRIPHSPRKVGSKNRIQYQFSDADYVEEMFGQN